MRSSNLTERQILANTNYQAWLKKRDDLGREIAVATYDAMETSENPNTDLTLLYKQYDAAVIQLYEAAEECRLADAAAALR
jgi:hypothetical protein